MVISGILYLFFRSIAISLWFLCGGVLVDFDHIYDYARYPYRDPLYKFNVKELFDVVENDKLLNVYLLFHSWELVVTIFIGSYIFPDYCDVLTSIGFGLGLHLALDTVINPTTIIGYSLIGRIRHGFSKRYFYRN